jgi:hypothetical protein
MVRVLVGGLLVGPPLVFLQAFEVGRRASSADEGLEGAFLIVSAFLALAVLAIVVFIRAAISERMGLRGRLIVMGLALSVVPMYFLVSATSWYIGWPGRASDWLATLGVSVLNLVWLVTIFTAHSKLEAARMAVQPTGEKPGKAP